MDTLEDLKSGKLKGAEKIKISAGLTEFPEEIFALADTLQLLDLSGNKIFQLPDQFSVLSKLRILFLSDNLFTEFPSILSQCPQLEMVGFKANQITDFPENSLPPKIRWLILTNNRIKALPKSIGNCTRLQKVMFAGNLLEELPEEMSACTNIELLRISVNQLTNFPEWLFRLPKLAWLAFAGNPCSFNPEVNNNLPSTSFNEFDILEKLGEGASGVISKARHKQTGEEVAVKVFKGEVTSDGLPGDEMKACMAAGTHPNLVKVTGKLTAHPENKQGLIFSLIPEGYKNLGMTPSFDSCTRDVFREGSQLSFHEILRILQGVASVALQLHSLGISHGDLYAHNILTDHEANPLFGDFGAGAFYDKSSPEAPFFEKIEVRAFGYLMDDLLGLLKTSEAELAGVLLLKKLKQDCLNEKITERPDFKLIFERLQVFITSPE